MTRTDRLYRIDQLLKTRHTISREVSPRRLAEVEEAHFVASVAKVSEPCFASAWDMVT